MKERSCRTQSVRAGCPPRDISERQRPWPALAIRACSRHVLSPQISEHDTGSAKVKTNVATSAMAT